MELVVLGGVVRSVVLGNLQRNTGGTDKSIDDIVPQTIAEVMFSYRRKKKW
jgi:hypothetical protein